MYTVCSLGQPPINVVYPHYNTKVSQKPSEQQCDFENCGTL